MTKYVFQKHWVRFLKPKRAVLTSHLDLFVLKDFGDAGVEGRAREHGRDWISEIQYRFEHRVHCLREREIG